MPSWLMGVWGNPRDEVLFGAEISTPGWVEKNSHENASNAVSTHRQNCSGLFTCYLNVIAIQFLSHIWRVQGSVATSLPLIFLIIKYFLPSRPCALVQTGNSLFSLYQQWMAVWFTHVACWWSRGLEEKSVSPRAVLGLHINPPGSLEPHKGCLREVSQKDAALPSAPAQPRDIS